LKLSFLFLLLLLSKMWKSIASIVVNCLVLGSIGITITSFFIKNISDNIDPNVPPILECHPSSCANHLNHTICPRASYLNNDDYRVGWTWLAIIFAGSCILLSLNLGIHDIALLLHYEGIEIWNKEQVLEKYFTETFTKLFHPVRCLLKLPQCMAIITLVIPLFVFYFTYCPLYALYNGIRHPVKSCLANTILTLWLLGVYAAIVVFSSVYWMIFSFRLSTQFELGCSCYCKYSFITTSALYMMLISLVLFIKTVLFYRNIKNKGIYFMWSIQYSVPLKVALLYKKDDAAYDVFDDHFGDFNEENSELMR